MMKGMQPPESSYSSTNLPPQEAPSASSSRTGNAPAPTLDPEQAWSMVQSRDTSVDLFYAVKTTGVFCRPSCPSRRPARRNVVFYRTAAEAVDAGYRACLRCCPLDGPAAKDAHLIERVCGYLRRHTDKAVTLEKLGGLTGMKPMTLQRRFQQILGITPRQFQIAERVAGFRRLATGRGDTELHGDVRGNTNRNDAASVTDALYDAGYSASSRLYSTAQQTLGMTPGRFRDGGRGESIVFVTAPCPLGYLLVAATCMGICWVALGDSAQVLVRDVRRCFRNADIAGEADATDPARAKLLQEAVRVVLSQLTDHPAVLCLPLDLRATVFQQRVWQALLAIPRGETRSYGEVAAALGQPTASRAIARACASNRLALLVPCHRVVGKDGSLSGYRWGTERKQALLALEGTADGAPKVS